MLTKNQAEDILIRFLTERYAHTRAVGDSDAWSMEDLRDLTATALE